MYGFWLWGRKEDEGRKKDRKTRFQKVFGEGCFKRERGNGLGLALVKADCR